MSRVITIDGPSGSGKGTIAQLLAEDLGWRTLDSGALYRVLGHVAHAQGIDLGDAEALVALASILQLTFIDGGIQLDGAEVGDEIRTETAGNRASKVAAHPPVREALLAWQRAQATEPGLVADGRDMGTVVFPEADLKFFLTASADERAKRRYNQLKAKGIDASLAALSADIRERDERDRNRAVAPLLPAEDAIQVDSSALDINGVMALVRGEVQERLGIG